MAKKVAVFVDGANVFHTQRKLSWNVDLEKLLNYCGSYGELVEAIYYTGVPSDGSIKRYLDKLAYIGYSLVTKPIKEIHDAATEQTIWKANLDVEMVLDMRDLADRYDIAVLVSGDGDFERALTRLKSMGKEVKVISAKGSVATEILYAVGGMNFIDFASIKDIVERKESKDCRAE